MEATKTAIDSLLTVSTRPKERTALEALVQAAIDKTPASSNVEMTRNIWEYHLRKAVIDFAATERSALHRSDASYYPDMRYRLELVLTFTDLKACTDVFPSSVLQDLFEAQTVGSCAVHFDWVEARAARLSAALVPNKGKALLFLKTFNDLLRRVPRHGRLASLSGRIGTWLANAYEISERSAVNLRGEYGPPWEDVNIPAETLANTKPDMAGEGDKEDEMQVDALAESVDEVVQKKSAEKVEFYNIFWSIQKAFARPSIFDPQGLGATTISDEFTHFKSAIEKILPYLKEASAKDRALMGLKAGSNATSAAPTIGTKRKRSDASVPQDYLFSKYLTNPELLDLEITDVHFRRQILFQVLIALHNLLQHTAAVKATRSNAKNQVPILRFTLPETDEAWVRETLTRVRDELRSSVPQGRSFDESVATMLAREENWMRWKLGNCDKTPFARPVWGETSDEKLPEAVVGAGGAAPKPIVPMWDATRDARTTLASPPAPWPHQYGSEALTEIWAMGYRELRDIQDPASFGTVADFAKQATLEDRKVDARKRQLRMQAERIATSKAKAAEVAAKESKDVTMTDTSAKTEGEGSTTSIAPPAPFVPPPFVMSPNDPVVLRAEETKNRVSWLALRTAREGYALTLAKASPPSNKESADGAGANPVDKAQFSNSIDLSFLAKELDNEQKRRETEREERAKSEPTQEVAVGDDEGKEDDEALVDEKPGAEGAEGTSAKDEDGSPDNLVASKVSDAEVKMETS